MSLPLYDGGVASGLFFGFLFGFILEGGGLGSPRKLVAQFTLRDFTVIKVMLSAVIVAAAVLWLCEVAGLLKPQAVYVPTLYFWAVAMGGALIGTGFAIGGYCPGTSAAGLASGRLDALVFMIGMVGGVWLFSGLFDDLRPLYAAAKGPDGGTLAALTGLPSGFIIAVLTGAGVALYFLARRLEKTRSGPLTPES